MNKAAVYSIFALALSACGGKSADSGGLDAKTLGRPAELLRLFAQPQSALGPRHFVATSSLEMQPPGRPAEALHETFSLDVDERGQLHLLHENDHDDGLEAIATGGRLYVRPRYGKFVVRRAEAPELARLRSNVEGVAAGYLRLVAPWLDVKVGDASTQNGRVVRVVHIGRRSSPEMSLRDRDASWRDGVNVTQLDGEFTVDAATGLPLDGHLDATYTFARSDLSGPVSAQLHYTQKSSTPPEAIAAPNEVATLKRPRPLLDRQALLDGLKTP